MKSFLQILLLSFLSFQAAGASITYDFVQQFSTNANPSGVWSYGYRTIEDNGFGLYPTYANLYPAPATGAWGFYTNRLTFPPTLRKATPGSIGASDTGLNFEILPGMAGPFLFLEYPVLRFTSPVDGSGSIRLLMTPIQNDERLIGYRGNQEVFSELVTAGNSYSNQFSFLLGQGATLDLAIRPEGGTNGFFGWAAKLIGAIEVTSSSTPPSVTFIPAASLFTNSVSVQMVSSTTNGTVRYTRNGSTPLAGSEAYSQAIVLTNATELRAAIFSNNVAISQVFTSSYSRVYAINDGIPASWREHYFGPGYLTDPRVSADADPDGDLSTNWEEYLAGTNPLNPASGFKATVAAVPRIRFVSVIGRSYRLLRRDQINGTPTVVTTLTATSTLTTYVDTSVTAPSGIYMVELLP